MLCKYCDCFIIIDGRYVRQMADGAISMTRTIAYAKPFYDFEDATAFAYEHLIDSGKWRVVWK